MTVALPNIRKMFIPDPGYTIFDADLSGADAQVVAWEADDQDLKEAFRKGMKIHAKNAEDIFGKEFTEAPGDIKQKSTPKGKLYDQCKRGVHATNYGASARTLSLTPEIAWPLRRCEDFQRLWFHLHPGIKGWHNRTELLLRTQRRAVNAFGYRRIYYDRLDSVFPEALAWVPQSTVALVTFYGALAVEDAGLAGNKPGFPVEFLLQVHDSLVFQIRTPLVREVLPLVKKALHVTVPYPDPLVIPWGLSSSTVSWGDCQTVPWPEDDSKVGSKDSPKMVA